MSYTYFTLNTYDFKAVPFVCDVQQSLIWYSSSTQHTIYIYFYCPVILPGVGPHSPTMLPLWRLYKFAKVLCWSKPVVLRSRVPSSSVGMATPKSVKFADEEAPKKPWQDSLNTSAKALSFLFSTGMLSDITFAVGAEGKQFRVSCSLANWLLAGVSVRPLVASDYEKLPVLGRCKTPRPRRSHVGWIEVHARRI